MHTPITKLEARRLFDATVAVVGDHLMITGDGASDSISVSYYFRVEPNLQDVSLSYLYVFVNSASDFGRQLVSSFRGGIVVDLGAGDDSFSASSTFVDANDQQYTDSGLIINAQDNGGHQLRVTGGPGNDTINGTIFDDVLDGGAGNDTIGTYGSDASLGGGDGNDVLATGDGFNQNNFIGGVDVQIESGLIVMLSGGAGDDEIRAASQNAPAMRVDGGAGRDSVTGSDNADVIRGGGNGDYVSAGAGDDSVYGDGGNDTITGGAGRNRLYGGDDDDRLNGGGGRDFLYGEAGDDRLYGNAGNDALDGGGGKDRVWAGDGDDALVGGSSVDRLYGEAGNDTFAGGPGNDYLFGGAGADVSRPAEAGDILDSVETIG